MVQIKTAEKSNVCELVTEVRITLILISVS